MAYEPTSPGDFLAYIMRRRGWNPPRLSEMTDGFVSPSSVRAYTGDKSRPRAGLALAIANAMGSEHGAALLRLWDYPDLADGFLETSRATVLGTNNELNHRAEVSYRLNHVEYDGDPLSDEGLGVIGHVITALQHMENCSEPSD